MLLEIASIGFQQYLDTLIKKSNHWFEDSINSEPVVKMYCLSIAKAHNEDAKLFYLLCKNTGVFIEEKLSDLEKSLHSIEKSITEDTLQTA